MEKWINSQDFDVINLSIHNNPLMEYYYESFFREYGIDKCLEMYFNQMMDAMLSMDDFDVLAHIDYGFKTAYNIDKDLKFSDYEHYLIPILKQLIKKDKALEINTKVQKAFPDTHLKYLLGLYFFWMSFLASVKYFSVNSLACKLGISTLFMYASVLL